MRNCDFLAHKEEKREENVELVLNHAEKLLGASLPLPKVALLEDSHQDLSEYLQLLEVAES